MQNLTYNEENYCLNGHIKWPAVQGSTESYLMNRLIVINLMCDRKNGYWPQKQSKYVISLKSFKFLILVILIKSSCDPRKCVLWCEKMGI